MNEYEEQAQKFLNQTNTEFKAEFIKYDLYFDDEKEKRDIYQITLKRGERVYKFTFGNSITASGEYTFYGKSGKTKIHLKRNKDGKKIMTYEGTTLNKGNSQINPDFKEPTAYDVLSCLQKYEVGTFEDFCGDFGYDLDSRKAEKIYNAVIEEYKNLKILYSDYEIQQLGEID